MTLPNYVKLQHLDSGIKELVINLNRIPQVYTQTTCEGHVWLDIHAWPAKNGFVHFQKPKDEHDGLVSRIKIYCHDNEIIQLTKWPTNKDCDVKSYTINGLFEPHQGEDGLKPFSKMSEKEQAAYWNRAEVRKEEILRGWKDINNLVIDYIIKELCVIPSELPYRNKQDKTDFRSFHCCH